MLDLENLPRQIMPEEFIELLQDLFSDHSLPPDAPIEHTVVTLHGAGGGTWDFGPQENRLVICEGASNEPVVHMTCSVSDWREFVAGRVRDLVRSQAQIKLLDPAVLTQLYAHAHAIEKLKVFAGDVQFIIEDTEEDTDYRVTITLGGQTPNTECPTTSVRIELDILGRLISQQEQIQNAFFAGKIRVDGDMNLAMGLMTSLMTP